MRGLGWRGMSCLDEPGCVEGVAGIQARNRSCLGGCRNGSVHFCLAAQIATRQIHPTHQSSPVLLHPTSRPNTDYRASQRLLTAMSPAFKSKSKFRPPAPTKFPPPSPVKPATQAGPPSSPRSTSSTSRTPHPLPAQRVALLDDLIPASDPSQTPRSDQANPAKQQLQRTGGSKDVGGSRGPGPENPRASHLLDAAWPAMQPIKKDDVTNSQTTDIHTDQDEEEDDFWRHSTQADSTIACGDTANLVT